MNSLSERPLKVSEVFQSIQGEGASAGRPAVFLRLALCNLRCRWCDTRYSWDWSRYDYVAEVHTWPIELLAGRLSAASIRRLVITGGEPLLQQAGLAQLIELLGPEWTVEIETNGTVAPSPALSARIDQWNVSPKLSHSGDPLSRRIRTAALEALRDTERAWLKIVVTDASDMAEAQALVDQTRWAPDRVLLMPEAGDRRTYTDRMPDVRRLAERTGFGVSRRLHIERFDGERGR